VATTAPNAATTAIDAILGPDSSSLGRVERGNGGPIRESDLVVTYAYYGAAKGRWERRAFGANEMSAAAWGEDTGDVFLNESIRVCNVPERVWTYEIGGYPLLKKWLGYRDAKRRPGTTLTLSEVEHFRSMVQRIAALLVLHARLDQLYEMCLADSLTRRDLLGSEA